MEQIADALGPDHVLLVRLHHLTQNPPTIREEYARRIIDVSSYSDLNDVLLASDALVTDYSSIYFDYAPLRRPIVFFPYDLEEYRDEVRGFYLDYESAVPGPIIKNVEDLSGALEEMDHARREEFLREYAPHEDGFAASRVVDRVLRPD